MTLGRTIHHYDPPLQRRLREWHRWQHRRCARSDARQPAEPPPEPFAVVLRPPARGQPHGQVLLLPGIKPHRWLRRPEPREYGNSLWQCRDCQFAVGVAHRRSLDNYYDCAGPPAPPQRNPSPAATTAGEGRTPKQRA